MFSAISSFFFGGEKVPVNGETENAVEYQTAEADDWLLVNVSDPENANKENFVIEQSVENSMIVLGECHKKPVEDVVEEEEDEDDVLTALPFLLPMDAPSSTSNKRRRRRKASSAVTVSDSNRSRVSLYPMGPMFSNFDKMEEPDFFKIPEEYYRILRENMEAQKRRILPLFSMITSPKVVCKRKPTTTKKVKQEKPDKRNNHPAEITRGIVPTPPTVEIKDAYAQHMKLLKPAQAARDQVVKKRQKRSHLNRQNKAYLYEHSNKHQHRRDHMFQHHSGANNNRKCC